MPSSQRSDGFSKRWVTVTRAMVPLTVMTTSVLKPRRFDEAAILGLEQQRAGVHVAGSDALSFAGGGADPEDTGSARAKMLGKVKKKIRIRERKKEVASGSIGSAELGVAWSST